MKTRLIAAFSGGLVILCSPAAIATQNVNEDIKIIDSTPTLIFDDSDVEASTWYVRGRNEFFAVQDAMSATDVLVFNPVIASTTIGYASSAAGTFSAAMGLGASAGGVGSTALGQGSSAQGQYSVGLGRFASSAGNDSTSVGPGSDATASGGVAVGVNAASTESVATALGPYATAGGWQGTAVGYATFATSQAVALGANAEATAQGSVAIGRFAIATQPGTIVLGSVAGQNGASGYADVAVGTISPQASFHVARSDGSAGVLVTETHQATGPRTLFEIENNGNPEFRLTNTANNNSWVFSAGLRFVVKNNLGDWVMRVTDTGDMEIGGDMNIGGTLTEMSDRNQKHAIVPLDGEDVLARVAQVPVSEWSYDGESAEQRHIGPMAQDFYAAFGLASGETRISARDMAGVNMAAIQALNEKLEQRNQALEERVVLLESLVRQLLPNVAAN